MKKNERMKKILVIGCGGAGKSTLAKELKRFLSLPLIHLDTEFWNPGWEATPKEEWLEKVNRIVAEEEWIMDGNYLSTMDLRLSYADTVIFLDYPRRLCLWRAIKRIVLHYGKTRADMTEGCNERFDVPFFRWIWNFKKNVALQIHEKLASLTDMKILIFKSPEETAQWLSSEENFLRNEAI